MTDEQFYEFVFCHETNMPVATIAQISGRTTQEVRDAYDRIFEERSVAREAPERVMEPWSEWETETLISMYKHGDAIASIAQTIGRRPSQIDGKLRTLEMAGRLVRRSRLFAASMRWSQKDVDTLLQMRADGATYGMISMQVGRSEKSCREKYDSVMKRGRKYESTAR